MAQNQLPVVPTEGPLTGIQGLGNTKLLLVGAVYGEASAATSYVSVMALRMRSTLARSCISINSYFNAKAIGTRTEIELTRQCRELKTNHQLKCDDA